MGDIDKIRAAYVPLYQNSTKKLDEFLRAVADSYVDARKALEAEQRGHTTVTMKGLAGSCIETSELAFEIAKSVHEASLGALRASHQSLEDYVAKTQSQIESVRARIRSMEADGSPAMLADLQRALLAQLEGGIGLISRSAGTTWLQIVHTTFLPMGVLVILYRSVKSEKDAEANWNALMHLLGVGVDLVEWLAFLPLLKRLWDIINRENQDSKSTNAQVARYEMLTRLFGGWPQLCIMIEASLRSGGSATDAAQAWLKQIQAPEES